MVGMWEFIILFLHLSHKFEIVSKLKVRNTTLKASAQEKHSGVLAPAGEFLKCSLYLRRGGGCRCVHGACGGMRSCAQHVRVCVCRVPTDVAGTVSARMRGTQAGRYRHGGLVTCCCYGPCRQPGQGWRSQEWALRGSAPAPLPRSPPPLAQAPTCAAQGHGAHSSQVDGVGLVMREELQPHITDADEKEGTQGQEVACGTRGQR